MSSAILSLGSNLGDRFGELRAAVTRLAPHLLALSAVYETPHWSAPDPVGDAPGMSGDAVDVPAYLNVAALVAGGGDDPAAWLRLARELEAAADRRRDPAQRFAPRTLDVDVIAVWTDAGEPLSSADPELTLPHPRAHLRAFVLRPWADIQPYGTLPGHGRLVDLLNRDPVAADLAALRVRPDLPLEPGPEVPAESGSRIESV